MIDESVVELGLKYLDGCIASGEQPTLRSMINYIDYHDRLIANLDEINEVLRQHPTIFVRRDSGRAELATGTGDITITKDEWNLAYIEHKNWAKAEYERLTGRKLEI